MIDIALSVVLLVVLGIAGLYIFKAKKRGEKCIGCPYAKQCNDSSCCKPEKTE